MKAKLFRVLDEGTEMVFLAIKFDDYQEKEIKLLENRGWRVTDRLTVLVEVGTFAGAAISTFKYPPYDLDRRSAKIDQTRTARSVAEIVRDLPVDEIPDTLDVTKYHPQR